MRKIITTIIISALMAFGSFVFTAPANAQTNYRDAHKRSKRVATQRHNRNYVSEREQDNYYNGKRPNIYDRHRKAINIAVGTGAGAVLGAVIGGKKGALIGAAAGVAGGAIFTAKQAPRNHPRGF